ncbi:uncharacterized protein CIMG_03694 [Coccidioides immitis RS]|uniref:Uncharacterized protein n=7 Tax=Coccidioides TaxID=5500 RepID=A0A0E1RWT2_COCIM|nr:uncharacterized protein CIMG_03694 [Coccidioides immitis RS]XP_003068563.1 hypothetical protein CPC735_005900 [Coccidioides posadasii C735 delta SOWgp]EFW20411.1 conserved hypothetical protein [Coccidioides posadasii str. Silveira]KMM73024.1 hypothetical protein CPAG_09313 [Coccidioides posadasii RMSCC 3488]KMP07919.1 hypothetical protein CIRG_07600 [Coccidioides immitis RMSCC 2394]KMU79045.1 hypothetical protein CISG_07352 [Coccidioides immitis RMSCC 3703]KMU85106.1 hypothetical protein C|eukprot:XP_003068563.1 hypothetical protein CPC735_005900 [Coccidioides posadasii C735 delta SOWgp]
MSPAQEYWLPGYGLSRHIVLSKMQYFLGPTASVRPYSYQGREGYLVTGAPLTRTQIDDLRKMSQVYEQEASIRMAQTSGLTINEKSDDELNEPFINHPVYVGRRDNRERDRVRERDGKPYPIDRYPRMKRSW